MNDSDVLTQVRSSVGDVRMDTPVEAIMAKARARRQRRVVGLGAVGVGAVAAVTAGVFALGGSGGSGSGSGLQSAKLAAFSVSNGPNGGSILTLRKGAQYRLDPDALRQALAQHGIPAVVNVGKMCDSHPEPGGLDQAISSTRLADGSVITTFDPSAIPSGAEISIGYFPTYTTFALVQDGAPLTCDANPRGPSSVGSQHSQRVTPGATP